MKAVEMKAVSKSPASLSKNPRVWISGRGAARGTKTSTPSRAPKSPFRPRRSPHVTAVLNLRSSPDIHAKSEIRRKNSPSSPSSLSSGASPPPSLPPFLLGAQNQASSSSTENQIFAEYPGLQNLAINQLRFVVFVRITSLFLFLFLLKFFCPHFALEMLRMMYYLWSGENPDLGKSLSFVEWLEHQKYAQPQKWISLSDKAIPKAPPHSDWIVLPLFCPVSATLRKETADFISQLCLQSVFEGLDVMLIMFVFCFQNIIAFTIIGALQLTAWKKHHLLYIDAGHLCCSWICC